MLFLEFLISVLFLEYFEQYKKTDNEFNLVTLLCLKIMNYFRSSVFKLNDNYYEIFFDTYGIAIEIVYIYKAYIAKSFKENFHLYPNSNSKNDVAIRRTK